MEERDSNSFLHLDTDRVTSLFWQHVRWHERSDWKAFRPWLLPTAHQRRLAQVSNLLRQHSTLLKHHLSFVPHQKQRSCLFEEMVCNVHSKRCYLIHHRHSLLRGLGAMPNKNIRGHANDGFMLGHDVQRPHRYHIFNMSPQVQGLHRDGHDVATCPHQNALHKRCFGCRTRFKIDWAWAAFRI